jgi:hypothetical protein
MRRSAAEFERGLGRDRFDVGDTADPVGAENLGRLFHSLTETLQCRFVNGKVRAEGTSFCWRMFTIAVAQENAFVLQTESDCIPL